MQRYGDDDVGLGLSTTKRRPQQMGEWLCEVGSGTTRLWELLGVLIGLVEFHARYRGGGVNYPFGTSEGIRAMIERQVDQAFSPKGGSR